MILNHDLKQGNGSKVGLLCVITLNAMDFKANYVIVSVTKLWPNKCSFRQYMTDALNIQGDYGERVY